MLNTLQSSRFGATLWLVLALQVPAAFATASTTTPPGGGGLAVTKGSQLLAQAGAAAPAGAAQLASVPVVATAPPAPEKLNNAMPAWTVSCASPARAVAPDCKLEQRLFARESQRLLSAVVIVIPGNTRQPVLYLQLPNGLALQEGVSMSIDAGPVAPPQLQSCDGSGCYATLALSPALLESMKAGKGLTVKATAANRELLTFQHLLADFSQAFESAK